MPRTGRQGEERHQPAPQAQVQLSEPRVCHSAATLTLQGLDEEGSDEVAGAEVFHARAGSSWSSIVLVVVAARSAATCLMIPATRTLPAARRAFSGGIPGLRSSRLAAGKPEKGGGSPARTPVGKRRIGRQ